MRLQSKGTLVANLTSITVETLLVASSSAWYEHRFGAQTWFAEKSAIVRVSLVAVLMRVGGLRSWNSPTGLIPIIILCTTRRFIVSFERFDTLHIILASTEKGHLDVSFLDYQQLERSGLLMMHYTRVLLACSL